MIPANELVRRAGYATFACCFSLAGLHWTTSASGQDISPPKAPEIENNWASDPEPQEESTGEEATGNDSAEAEETGNAPEAALAEVSYDLDALPFPARRMRELILEATRSGDLEKLRGLVGVGESMTQLSLGGVEGDPIDFLKEQSGDNEGHEILAILEEVLEAGYVRLDPDTERELYVWPYFYAYPIDQLTPRQRVEMFRIITYGDFEDMKDFGGYIFYRVGISPTGRWRFFVAGD